MQEAHKIVGDDGQIHVEDEVVDLSPVTVEGWVSLGFFWLLGLTVFYQFLTRYALNDSAAWTEEIARYLLIATVFIGAAVGVAKNNHIQVDFFYRFMPTAVARAMAIAVDVMRTLFYAATVVLTGMLMQKMDSYNMTIVDLPMNIVYGVCLVGFAAMFVRSVQVALVHWRRGYSVLERPETTMDDR
ncbi:TRAP transporter small permease [Acidovorax sp.]|uniref:TRAP transporter small permease n=1 Tax=Acidovorax sp. TaxID=1872122 RepID=UPI00260B3336|nr:TRAP transporter small permease [Acidovorax sp.]